MFVRSPTNRPENVVASQVSGQVCPARKLAPCLFGTPKPIQHDRNVAVRVGHGGLETASRVEGEDALIQRQGVL